jgi:hypothetical protein
MVDIVAELLPRKAPETLYHYTTQAGLIGVIRDTEIWATHTQYLNDRREYVHAIGLVRDAIGDRLKSAANTVVKEVLEEMFARVSDDLASINVCVCSFSEDGDSLSQWRAYCEPMAGYAIGFDSTFLVARGAKQQFVLTPCLYSSNEQSQFVNDFLDRVVAENLQHRDLPEGSDDYEFWHSGGNFVAFLHRIAPVLKDKSFESEREWRLISRPLMNTNPNFAYRPGRSMVVPFFKVQLGVDPDEVGSKRFHQIVVGPTPNPRQALGSVRSLLASVKLMNTFTPGGPVRVDTSAVPYRAW